MKSPVKKMITLAAAILTASAVFGQTASTLAADVATLHDKIQQAIRSNDLRTASKLSRQIVSAISAETTKTMPTPAERLARAEATWQKGANLPPDRKIYYLLLLPQAATQAGDYSKSAQYGGLLLDAASQAPTSLVYEEAVFEANTALGQAYVKDGDFSRARQALLDSSAPFKPAARIPQLRYDLAQSLLDRGEREAVIAFLQKCTVLPRTDAKVFSELIAAINGGTKPTLSTWR